MKNLLVLALTLGSGISFAGVNVEQLPLSVGVPCSVDAVTLSPRLVELLETNDSLELVVTRSLALYGSRADQVSSVTLETVEPGFFPKCAVILK